jgi:Predicted N-acetylglucosamine kinase
MKLIGMDSGGTSCRLVLCDGTGAVLSACRVAGHNPNIDGFDAVEESYRQGLRLLLKDAGGEACAVDALFAGIAGGEGDNKPRLTAILERLLPNCGAVRVSNDALIALASGLGRSEGGVLIAGTGTIGFLRKGGRLLRFGGWGYLADRGGSGWHIGRDGFRAAMAGEDAGLPRTALTGLFEKKLGMSMTSAVPALYRGEIRPAECAPLVLQAAEAGDEAAMAVLRYNADCLRELLAAMCRVFGREECPVVLAGGLLSRDSLYLRLLKEQCADLPLKPILPALPPVFGAACLAAEAAGCPDDPDFTRRFAATFTL